MTASINKVAVLGSGVMGAGIAAHLANLGIPVYLLDIVPSELTKEEEKKGLTLKDKPVRNRLSKEAVKKLHKQKPAPLTVKENAGLIIPGNMEDDMEKLREVDWVIEVVVERLDIKQKVLGEVDNYRKEGAIVSSNTSGISIEAMAEGRSEEFRSHFLGTHFFNPPRYLKLLEVIPTKDTNPEILAFMKKFGEETLGKGVVEAKDTPNFIGNRIGTYGLLVTVREMMKAGLSIGQVDSVTGPLIGRPKSATFRTLDVVGLDTFLHVAKNVYDQVDGEEKEVFDPPAFMNDMAERGWLGSKSGQGFFLKQKGEKGSEILELNYETMEYQPSQKLKTPAVEQAKQAKKLPEKLQTICFGKDEGAQFVWNIIKSTLLYSAEKAQEIANDIVSIDEAMKWGFGWELGPFEIWDALGFEKTTEKMKTEGDKIPEWVETMVEEGYTSFYEGTHRFYHQGAYHEIETNEKVIHLKSLKNENRVIMKNAGASLIDLGDEVAGLEFNSPNNSIGLDVIQMINKSLEEVNKNYKGLVIGNQGKNFCVGANLMMILMEAQDDNYMEVDMVVRQFQQAMMNIHYSDKPVVTAPFAMALGGGAEICLPSASMQASSETYMGLVEAGVGLIPGGGGNKELYMKQLEGLPEGASIDLQAISNQVFETIAMAKVGTSAAESAKNGFMNERDAIIANGDHILYAAKRKVIDLFEKGYRAPIRKKVPVVGETGYAAMKLGAKTLQFGGQVSEHDMKIADKLAFVLAGGRVPKGTLVDEDYLLDLEREAFLSLVAEPKSQQRMQHMLSKGKPLRN
ncbi:3-hydroxyacyl-CoA dehydrogenase/enoyl-CoA hydratase family protein [Salsuginibacillus kocurii]|uniref:3-hydroxyacyl-CoA dehydrogenase/enoyl-CoA hydratase family protein n=1 Tax=Salsuginibacillus kocurii TaxID=427078 RepID=UPI000365F311|nr:3-hydroxyacyl-CoA dehydrogenase/enoyl-CoA hydratase family protein [Salsuginibacillus kocurii]